MTDFLYNVWLVLLGLLKMFPHYLGTGIGILGDFLDAIGIIGKTIATAGAVIGLLIALNHERWYVNRKKK